MTGRPPTSVLASDLRQKHTLVRREPDRGLTAVLLCAGAPASAREALRTIGFRPESTDDAVATWIGDLESDFVRLHAALGPDALFDVGPVFRDVGHRLADAPSRWPGRFALHVGGTQRCLVFDDPTRDDLEPVLQREIDDYFVKDWSPATE